MSFAAAAIKMGSVAKLTGGLKKSKKRKEAKKQVQKDVTPQVVTKTLADNQYQGIIRDGLLGSQFLECPAGKYTWTTGTVYEGSFSSSNIEGRGKFQWPDGSIYEGELLDGKRHGKGVFIAADGVTQYTGQWCFGKRDGQGKLTYDKEGKSFYDGGWKDGRKHGQGKQVWPSGNMYEGQWEHGKMRGIGTMKWKVGIISEQYTGHWENNVPQGEGTHVWRAAGVFTSGVTGSSQLAEKPPRHLMVQPGQQLNNRYEGQWQAGRRQGHGTFYYGNGANYQGDWQDHVKHGKGRHTFENGRVYEGPFEEDRMTDDQLLEASGGVVHPRDDDNPISRCTDIQDLQAVALPSDNTGFENALGTGYTDPAKILGEAYNTLLRYLGEVRELYYRYRQLLPMAGEDPFVLSSYQCWLFARDAGLLTPNCSVARLDRWMSSGPRHHRETAPEDEPEVRPLTPRFMARAESNDFNGSSRPDTAEGSPTSGEIELADSEEGYEDGDSGDSSPSNGAAGDLDGRVEAQPQIARRDTMEHPETPHEEVMEARGLDMTEVEVGGETKFQRAWTSRHLANIHVPTKPFLFRQFLEGLARLSTARFPQERGLESQMQRLFKERLLPMTGMAPSNPDDVWGFLVDQDLQVAMRDYRPQLSQVFRSLAIGEDWGAAVSELSRPGTGADGCVPLSLAAFGRFGAPVRRLHVRARMDVTIRVKDVLKLLDRMGLLRPMKWKALPPVDDPFAELFCHAECEEEEEELSEVENGSGGSVMPDPDNFEDGIGVGGSFPKAMPFTSVAKNFAGLGMPKMSVITQSPTNSGIIMGRDVSFQIGERTRSGELQEPLSMKPKAGEPGRPAKPITENPELEDFYKCNFTISPLKVLRLVAEVLSPQCLTALRWRLDPANFGPGDEFVSLLEFAEHELVFAEFLRLLVHIMDVGTSKDTVLCERWKRPKRFHGFMTQIFLPALKTPYSPPVVEPADKRDDTEAPGAADEDEEEDDDEDLDSLGSPTSPGLTRKRMKTGGAVNEAAGPKEAAEAGDGEAHEEAEKDGEEREEKQEEEEEDQTIELWYGFDTGRPRAVFSRTTRAWPAEYEKAVLEWC